MRMDGRKKKSKIMKQKSGYEKKLHYLTKGFVIAFVAILVICYTPKIRFYRNELPNLEFYSENENADEFVKLPDEFEKEQILCFWTNHQNVKTILMLALTQVTQLRNT